MKVTKFIVTAARTWPDPHIHYANLRPEITLEAEYDPNDPRDVERGLEGCVEHLQAIVEGLLDDHIEHLCVARTALENNDRMSLAQKRALKLETLIRNDQIALKKEREPKLRNPRKEGL